MATLTMSAGGGIVSPKNVQSPWNWRSYSVDGRTCLHLRRNDKKRKRSRSVQMQGEFCFITSCFHWWFRYKKRLPLAWGAEDTGAQPIALQAPEERRKVGVPRQHPGVKAYRGHCPGALACATSTWKDSSPLPPDSAPNSAQGLNGQSLPCPDTHVSAWCSALSGRTHCPGSHGQEAAFI